MSKGPAPSLVFADESGQILDAPGQIATCRVGRRIQRITKGDLIPLPEGTQLYHLPGRYPVAWDEPSNEPLVLETGEAVAACLPPGYTALSLAGYSATQSAPMLPLFNYAAVCWYKDEFFTAAQRVEQDPKHSQTSFTKKGLRKRINRMRREKPDNRLIGHLADNCSLKYDCANAKNLFYNRWECPIPLTASCNATCVGCISALPDQPIPSPQERLDFVPSLEDVLDIAIPHLETAPEPMVSFGQGCEGEPLLQSDLMLQIIARIRSKTSRGLLHLNTNGSRPKLIEQLCAAGLDSIRVSLNSAQPLYYEKYYRPRLYRFDDVQQSIALARRANCLTSINYLSFPGFTDSPRECAALKRLIESTGLQMIQWRNLNIDPDIYCDTLDWTVDEPALGMKSVLRKLKTEFPKLRHGYVNPPKESWQAELQPN